MGGVHALIASEHGSPVGLGFLLWRGAVLIAEHVTAQVIGDW